ncbi:MAG TPA: ferredoxin reductase, partial [Casimicrobiaceae bacterium]|nr:ferredoxin reductase [Casimicrobiaceae bacterium]
MKNALLNVRVLSVRYEAEDIKTYELVNADGGELPPFSAGAHVDLHLGDGRIRQYSLANDPIERHRYVVGILRDTAGRGGSVAIFENVHPGRMLTISAPRNHFPLAGGAQRHLLLAGGIGVTPMMAMLAQLERENADFLLHYCTRSPQKTAFRESLARPCFAARTRYYHDGGDPRRGLDIPALLRERPDGTHLYYCGPPGFMTAVAAASAHWPKEAVHFEYFTPPAQTQPAVTTGAGTSGTAANAAADIRVGFKVRLASTGALYEVPNDKS